LAAAAAAAIKRIILRMKLFCTDIAYLAGKSLVGLLHVLVWVIFSRLNLIPRLPVYIYIYIVIKKPIKPENYYD